jgi:uncharacterized protein YraI
MTWSTVATYLRRGTLFPYGRTHNADGLREEMPLVGTVIRSVALLALSSGLAAAAPATLERSAKVHSGPGIKYQVVATLRRGTVIDVSGCSSAWCEVAWRGGQGYVAHTLLAAGPTAPAAVGVAPGQSYYVDDYPGFDYPGYAYEPGIVAAPRPHRRSGRWPGWRHRSGGSGWAGRANPSPIGLAPGMKNAERMPRAGGVVPGSDPASGGALRGARSMFGTGAAANGMTGSIGAPVVSVPVVSAPTVSAPATSAPVVSAPAASPPAANAPSPN